jgi:signal transduction histidine kinase
MKFRLDSQKVSIASSIFVATFLLYGIFFYVSQQRLLRTITDAKLSEIQSYYEREEREQTSGLNSRADAVCGTIAKLSAIQLENSQTYNLLKEGLATTLEPFMDYSEIAAIEVRDKDNHGYISMWRDHGAIKYRTDYMLPMSFRREYGSVVRKPAISNGVEQGVVTVYIDDKSISQATARIKDELKESADAEVTALRNHFRSTLAPQAAVLFVGIVFILVSSRLVGRSYSLIEKQRQELAVFNRELEQRVEERTAELDKVHKQLLDASRQAGMAEVATGVLHNVGNVLNSVNVSADVIKNRVAQSHVRNLSKASALMESHRHDLGAYLTSDEKGKILPDYFTAMAKELSEENAAVLQELEVLARGVEHIKQVVQTQQDFAKNSTFRQPCKPAALIENALHINLISLERHKIEIVREVQDVGEVDIDKHKILQVLINLISNAKNALTQSEQRGERKITVRLRATDEGPEKRLRFEVSDTGIGIARENLAKIFTHGFTTRTGGHGFGLHTAANAAHEMSGTLTAYSDGIGKGATFVLEVPIEQTEESIR